MKIIFKIRVTQITNRLPSTYELSSQRQEFINVIFQKKKTRLRSRNKQRKHALEEESMIQEKNNYQEKKEENGKRKLKLNIKPH